MNGTGDPSEVLMAADGEANSEVSAAAAAARGVEPSSGEGKNGPAKNIIVQFVSAEDGSTCGPQIELPMTSTVSQMQKLVNKLLENVCSSSSFVICLLFTFLMINRKRQCHIVFM